jgi:hypothetical protein
MPQNELIIAKSTDTMDFAVAKNVADVLNKHYAGYMWAVNADSQTGMVQIRNLSLSGDWGFNLHMTKVQEDVSGKLIRDAGGEILERYRVSRGMIKHQQVDELATDFAGRALVDLTGAQYAG